MNQASTSFARLAGY